MTFKNAIKESLFLSLPFIFLQFLYKIYTLTATFTAKRESINLDIYVEALAQSPKLQLDVAYFIFSHFILFSIFSCAILICAYGAGIISKYAKNNLVQVYRLLWLYSLATVLIINARLYPESDYAAYISHIYNSPIATVFAYLISGSIILFSIIFLASFIYKHKRISVTAFAVIASINLIKFNHTAEVFDQPNIVIIGIDSFRPDMLVEPSNPAPYIKELATSNTTYDNAYTPLARTFPSWITTLTGRHPQSTGLRVNLQTIEKDEIPKSLGHILQDKGYYTLYATDEKRFSNLDENFGFNEVVGPSIGIHDFLFGHIADFPLSNLTSEWKISRYLFPYTYANRAVAHLYNPDTYVDLALDEVKSATKKGKPLFVATHFCLPHWPFTWKGMEMSDDRKENYLATITRADQQVKDFMSGLESSGVLKNAIVIVMSDHGETFMSKSEEHKDLVPSTSFSSHHIDYSHAHGTDLVSINQNKILLSFIDKTATQNFAKNLQHHDIVSLLDITPTLASYLDPEKSHNIHNTFDGISLMSDPIKNNERVLFLETGFTVSSINDIEISVENVIEETIDFYKVDKQSGRLRVLPDKQPKIVETKQRGVVSDDWLLVHSPQPHTSAIITLVDLHSGKSYGDSISRDLLTHLEARRAGFIEPLQPAHLNTARQLYSQLKSYYGSEIDDSSDPILSRFEADSMKIAHTQN